MPKKKISKDNILSKILDFPTCKQILKDAKKAKSGMAILCPHYSINVQSNDRYKADGVDPEQLDWDLDELSNYLGHMVSVSDFDDLVVDLMPGE